HQSYKRTRVCLRERQRDQLVRKLFPFRRRENKKTIINSARDDGTGRKFIAEFRRNRHPTFCIQIVFVFAEKHGFYWLRIPSYPQKWSVIPSFIHNSPL